MKIALAQMEVVPGRPRLNLETMLGMIEQARDKQADLVAFPEQCLSGYLIGDKFADEEFCDYLMEFDEMLRPASQGIAIVYGNIFMDSNITARVGDGKPHPNKDGRTRKYNAVRVFQNGAPAPRAVETNILPPGVQPKTLLPNYRFFEDERYFFSLVDQALDFGVTLKSLAQPFLLDVKGQIVKIGVEVCEDLWCEDYRLNGKPIDITKLLIQNGAQYIINVSASPWTVGKNEARDRRIKYLKQNSGKRFKSFHYVNCVGAQNNGKNIITFDGGTTVYNAQGDPVLLHEQHYQQDIILVNEEVYSAPAVSRHEKPRIAQKLEAIVRGIRHLKDMSGWKEHPKFILGMSGGIDSCIEAAILTLAVGADKVYGVNLPTKYNSTATKSAAAFTAQQLDIGYREIPIGEIVEIVERTLTEADLLEDGRKLSSLNLENIPAKIRGTDILSNLAAKYGALMTNNGNKVELFFGYATLYGDINGAIAPLADLTKAEIFELARYLNQMLFEREVISEKLIPDHLYRFRADQIPPTAELKEKQIDPMFYGYHCAMIEKALDYKRVSPEQFMRWYLNGTLHAKLGIQVELMERWGVDQSPAFIADLENFAQALHRSIFKRPQTCPIVVTSKTSFGNDYKESILPLEPSFEFDRLKARILNTDIYHPKEGVH